MSKHSEQRSYSVDEMMEKLKEGERAKRRGEDSELVTRPDGTQVVRVRRRKRRSNQPAKVKQVRQRRYGVIALVGIVALVVIAAVAILVLLARFNSKGYRDSLKERVMASIGANAGISDLVVTPTSARASSFEMAWPTGGIAKTLKLEDLQAKLEPGSFVGGKLEGSEVLADSGTLVLGPPDGTIVATVTDGEFPFDYGGYRCGNFEVLYGTTIDDPALRMTSCELTLRAKREGGVQFLLNGGNARLGPWEDMKVDRGLAQLRGGRFEIEYLRFRKGEEGLATVTTDRPIVSGGLAILGLELESYPLGHLVGGEDGFGDMIQGVVNAPVGSITMDPRFLDSGTIDVQFAGKEGSLEQFRFLSRLSSILSKIYYTNPNGGAVEGRFRKDKDGTRIENFKFEAKRQLVIEGNFAANAEGELSGRLIVGVPDVLMMHNEEERKYEAFSMPNAAGYCLIELELSGTLDSPADNFFEVLRSKPTRLGPTRTRPNEEVSPESGISPVPPPGGIQEAPTPPPSEEPVPPATRDEALESIFDDLTK